MKNLWMVIIGVVAVAAVGDSEKMANFVIDLDLAPEARWTEVVAAYRDEFPAVLRTLPTLLPAPIRGKAIAMSEEIGVALEARMGEYGREMAGIARQLEVSNGAIVLLNCIYEFMFACTSVVAQTEDGQIIHGRNQDLGSGGADTDLLRRVVFHANFTQNGVVQYEGNTYAGYVGLPTGMRPGRWGLSLDATVSLFTMENEIMNILNGLLNEEATLISIFVRTALLESPMYADALSAFVDQQLVAPVYVILSGAAPGEGAVITHLRTHAIDVWNLTSSKYEFYLAETNYNHWEPNPISDPRRQVIVKCMNGVGQDRIDLESLYKCLSEVPVMNWLTTYTTVMNPGTSEYVNYVRYCCL